MEFTTSESLVLAAAAMLAGIILLVRGGDWTIDSSVFVARRFGVSQLIVGFTIVAFGTSLPELVVSVMANLEGSAGIALGNVVGSNIANMLMVLGAAALFTALRVSGRTIYKDLAFMLGCTVLLGALLFAGTITQIMGAGMVALLLVYVLYRFFQAKAGKAAVEEVDEPEYKSLFSALFFLAVGLGAIALGAEFLVRGAKISASMLGVPEAVIALSIIAFGTSLPELSTCIIAGKKGHSDLVLGNIVGSNVFNILMIIGLTSLVKPIASGSFAPQIINFDIWVAGLVAVVLGAILFYYKQITKPIGVAFLASYAAYNIYIYAIYVIGS